MKTSDRILAQLKHSGAQNIKQLSDLLELTSMGVRQHLNALVKAQVLDSFEKKEKVGRPTRYWQLSALGHQQFADRHGDFSVQLIDSVQAVFGDEGLTRLVAQREMQSIQKYRIAMAGAQSVEARLQAFSDKRTQEGYMARCFYEDESWWFVEDHCPICRVAKACNALCDSELNLLKLLFDDCDIKRTEHLIGGQRRCVYRLNMRI